MSTNNAAKHTASFRMPLNIQSVDTRMHRTSYRRSRSRRAATLLELVVSLPASLVLIGCMGACIGMMAQTRSQDDNLFKANFRLSDAISQIASDLESATAFSSLISTNLEFLVPDRNNDGLPEQIKYTWGNTASPKKIFWSINGSTPTEIYNDAGNFQVAALPVNAPSSVAFHQLSDVAVLKSIDCPADGKYTEQSITSSNAIGQYFIPDGVSGSGKWDLGSVRVMVRAGDTTTDGILRIRITRADASRRPTTSVLADVTIPESRLGPDYRWLTIPLAPIGRQTSTTPICVTLSYAGGTGAVARVMLAEATTATPSNAFLLQSTNGGTSWTVGDGKRGLRFYAFGFYDSYSGTRKFITSIDLRITNGTNPGLASETSIAVFAKPEVSSNTSSAASAAINAN